MAMNTENRYPRDVVERMAINLYQHGDTVAAYDLIFDNPELCDEIERNTRTRDQ
jgi:hypothetical protein